MPAQKQTKKLPTAQELIDFLNDKSQKVSKRDIARNFGLKGEGKAYLKRMLKQIVEDGALRKQGRQFVARGVLPEILPVEVTGQDSDGRFIARPTHWEEDVQAPQILISKSNVKPKIRIGDIVQAKVRPLSRKLYDGIALKRLQSADNQMVGILFEGRIMSVDRRFKEAFLPDASFPNDLKSGDLVLVTTPAVYTKNAHAHFIQKIGKSTDAHAASLIAIFAHHLTMSFTSAALKQAEKAKLPALGKRTDLRTACFVTVDGADAKDFDDAVFAEPDFDKSNAGGWHLMIAIADVAHFVRYGDALDKDAFLKGNSTYFPDRVLPMLPEALSNGLCSLNPNEDRPAMVCEVWIDKNGQKLKHHFMRAMIKSKARLTYDEVEADFNGTQKIEGLGDLLSNLKGAYESLLINRQRRGVLELDVPERQVVLNDKGRVISIRPRARYASHKMIEEMMILANVSAAETLEKLNLPTMYRVHDRPSDEKLASLKSFLKSYGLILPDANNPTPNDFNALLQSGHKSASALSSSLDEMVLRTQSQAEYSPENIGHFGLSLDKYAHFTSPIRRYADILIHRALIKGLKLGDGALSDDEAAAFEQIAEHISATERQSAAAEQDATDRYVASYLADRVGEMFQARISSVTAFGLFVSLDEYGADGLVPMRLLSNDDYQYDEVKQTLTGKRSHIRFMRGQLVDVILKEAVPLTGGLLFTLVSKNQRRGSRRQRAGNRSFHPA